MLMVRRKEILYVKCKFSYMVFAQVFCFAFSLYVIIIISVFVVFLGEISPLGDPKKRDCKGPKGSFWKILTKVAIF